MQSQSVQKRVSRRKRKWIGFEGLKSALAVVGSLGFMSFYASLMVIDSMRGIMLRPRPSMTQVAARYYAAYKIGKQHHFH